MDRSFESSTGDKFADRLEAVSGAMGELHRAVIEAGDIPYEAVIDPDFYLNRESAQLTVNTILGRIGAKLSGILRRGETDTTPDEGAEIGEPKLYDPLWVKIGLNMVLGAKVAESFVDTGDDFYDEVTSITVSNSIDGPPSFTNDGTGIEVRHNSGDKFTPIPGTTTNERVRTSCTSTIVPVGPSQYVHHLKTIQTIASGFGLKGADINYRETEYHLPVSPDSDLPFRLLESLEIGVTDLRRMDPAELRQHVAKALSRMY